MPTVSILVPWRNGCEYRRRAWAWARGRWMNRYPNWQIVEGRDPDGPWSKGVALLDALSRADGDICVVADADVWTDGVDLAVQAIADGVALWAVPHRMVYRFGEEATGLILGGQEPSAAMGGLAQRAYEGLVGGGMTVMSTALLREVPIDPRFAGWGSEDEAWGLALHTMAPRSWRGDAPLWHLWHPPQQRLNRHVGNRANHALHMRYRLARNPQVMRSLIDEGRQYANVALGVTT